MISNTKPEGFNPKFSVAGCVIEHDGKILLLKYPDSKKDNPNKWASPAGKIDPGETAKDAVIREIFEETGLEIDPQKLIFIEQAYDRYPSYDYIYYLFRYKILSKERPNIRLKIKEHISHKWSTVEEALKEDLVCDHDYCIKKVYGLLR